MAQGEGGGEGGGRQASQESYVQSLEAENRELKRKLAQSQQEKDAVKSRMHKLDRYLMIVSKDLDDCRLEKTEAEREMASKKEVKIRTCINTEDTSVHAIHTYIYMQHRYIHRYIHMHT